MRRRRSRGGRHPAERIDFLKQAMASRGERRAYDIKAQISLAAFVLSGNHDRGHQRCLWGERASGARHRVRRLHRDDPGLSLGALAGGSAAAETDRGRGCEKPVLSPRSLGTGATQYSERLKGLAVEPELTAEALKLSYIRKIKARRFKNALIATLVAYLVLAAAFFAVGRCAF